MVGEETVCEDVGGGVHGEVREGTCKVVAVCRDGGVVTKAAERMEDGQVISIRTQRHVRELLELSKIQADGITTGILLCQY